MDEYRCFIEYMDKTGEARLTVEEDGLSCFLSLDGFKIKHADITAFDIINFRLIVQTGQGTLTASQLGAQLNPLYMDLYEKYNNKVLKSLFVNQVPILDVKGEFKYNDEGGSAEGSAYIKLFDRCLCILPPNENARRIPLCFIQSIEKGNYSFKLILNTNETYELFRLGWDTESFQNKLNESMEIIRKNAIAAALALDSTLDALQTSQIARLMPEGVAAPLDTLNIISPSLAQAVELKIKESRAKETYLHFREICQTDEILVGTKSNLAGEDQKDIIWFVASKSKGDGGIAAVEMALSEETAAATFLYSFSGGWDIFGRKLNQAIEAIDFHREVISISDQELSTKENAEYRMTVKRTPSLQFIRKCYAGRVIHRTLDSWKKDLDAQLL